MLSSLVGGAGGGGAGGGVTAEERLRWTDVSRRPTYVTGEAVCVCVQTPAFPFLSLTTCYQRSAIYALLSTFGIHLLCVALHCVALGVWGWWVVGVW